MKKLIASLLLATALVSPSLAMAREVTISTTMSNYYGNNAYLAIYVTRPDGTYDSTIWVAGRKTRYYGDLRGWVRALQTASSLSLDGITGASVGAGRTLTLRTNLSDAMIDAGYRIHVESAVENGGDYPDDAVAPLTSGTQEVSGSGYVQTLKVSM